VRKLDVESRSRSWCVRQPLKFISDEIERKVRTPQGKVPRVTARCGSIRIRPRKRGFCRQYPAETDSITENIHPGFFARRNREKGEKVV
jgi:hypothetical protein